MMKKLIVVEGFDRCGKDTLLEDIEKNDIFVFRNDLAGLPKYDKEQDDFLKWLDSFIEFQVNHLNELFKTHDKIVLTRFIISDEVYSTLFNRKHTVMNYLHKLDKQVEIHNYCLLFYSYNEYLKRLDMLGEQTQYNEKDFNEINGLYERLMNEIGFGNKVKHVFASDTREDIKKDFLNYLTECI